MSDPTRFDHDARQYSTDDPSRRQFVRSVGAGALGLTGATTTASGETDDPSSSSDTVTAPWDVWEIGVDDYSFEFEPESTQAPENPPAVTFGDDAIVVSGTTEFPRDGCDSLAPRVVSAGDGVVGVAVDEFERTELEETPDALDCGDAVQYVEYELTVVPEESAEAVERVVVDERFDDEERVVRYRDGEPLELPAVVAEVELEDVGSISPWDAADVQPTVTVEDDEWIVQGAIAYGSSSCGRVELADVHLVDDPDDGDATGGDHDHVGIRLVDGTQPTVMPGDACTDDLLGARYRLTLVESEDATIDRLTVNEDGMSESYEVTADRPSVSELPTGVVDYELSTFDAAYDDVEADPTVWTASGAERDRVVVEGAVALTSGSCNAVRLSDVWWEAEDHLAARIDDTRVINSDDDSTDGDDDDPVPILCTDDAPAVGYHLSLAVESLPAAFTASEGRERNEEPDRSVTVELPETVRTDVPDGVESIAVRLGEDAHDYAIEPPTPVVGFEDGEFVAANDVFEIRSALCSTVAVTEAEFATEERRHFGVVLSDADRDDAPEDCDDALSYASYGLYVSFEDEPPRTVHLTEDHAGAERTRVADRGHEPELADVVEEYDLGLEAFDAVSSPEIESTPDVQFEDDRVVVHGVLTLSGSSCRELALQHVRRVDGSDEHLEIGIGGVYEAFESPFGGCTLDTFLRGYTLELDLEAAPAAVTVVEDGEENDVTVTVERGDDQCASTAEVDGQTVCDLNGDGNYRDVTNSGDVTAQDLQLFFDRQHTEPWDSRTDLFDFTDNGDVGQPDVVDLFHEL